METLCLNKVTGVSCCSNMYFSLAFTHKSSWQRNFHLSIRFLHAIVILHYTLYRDVMPTAVCSFRQVLGRNGLFRFTFSRNNILKNIFKEVSSVDPTNFHRLRLWSLHDSQRGHP